MMLKLENISYSIGNKKILDAVSARFEPGRMNMILGPNGSGKSSLLKIFSGELNKYSGAVFYGEEKLAGIKKEALAKQRAVMSQQPELNFPLTVEEVVLMGRYPHFNFNPGKHDADICREVMEKMNLSSFKDRNYLTLSGGEKQRVQYARVLSQVWETSATGFRYLFLDEPLNSLDIKYQQEFLQTAKQFTNEHTVFIAVMHELNLALQYGDELFFLKEGKLVSQGNAKDITEELVQQVFNVPASVIINPVNNQPLVVYNSVK